MLIFSAGIVEVLRSTVFAEIARKIPQIRQGYRGRGHMGVRWPLVLTIYDSSLGFQNQIISVQAKLKPMLVYRLQKLWHGLPDRIGPSTAHVNRLLATISSQK